VEGGLGSPMNWLPVYASSRRSIETAARPFDELAAAERHAGGEVGDAAVHELSETQGAAFGQDVPDLGGREPFAGGVAITVVFADAGFEDEHPIAFGNIVPLLCRKSPVRP